MSFSIFTWMVAVCWVSLFAKTASWMRRKMAFLHYFSLFPFLLLLSLCMVRVFFFAEFPFTITIESKHILSSAHRFLCTPFFSTGRLRINLAALLTLLWGCKTARILLKHYRKYHYFRQSLKLLPENENIRLSNIFHKSLPHGRLQKATMIVHGSIPSPAVVGLLHPVILLPDLDFTDDELLGIFLHEGAHYRFGHCMIKCVTEIVYACFWWNPFFRELASEIEHALEMQADKAVCQKLTPLQQRRYLEGILKVVSHMDHTRLAPSTPCCLVAEQSEEKLQQRFLMVLEKQYRSKKKWDAVAIPLILSLFLCSYSFVLQPYGEPTLADYGENLELFPPGYYLVEKENGYDFYDTNDQLIDNKLTMNSFMEMVPVLPAWERPFAEKDSAEQNGTEKDDAEKDNIKKDGTENNSTEQNDTQIHGNRTGYKYRWIDGKFYRRLWSYTYQKWEDGKWQPFKAH